MSITGSSSEKSRGKAPGRAFLGCFFTVFMIVGLGFTLFFAWPVVEIVQARSWRQVPCTILTSEVERHSSSKGGPTFNVAVTYEYFVDDQRYVSSRYKFMGGSSSGVDAKQAIVDRLSPGTQTYCYVNRRNASEAVIERGFTTDLLFGFIPMIFVLVGLGGLYGIFVHRSKPRRPGEKTELPAQGASLPAKKSPKGPKGLKSSGSPGGRLGCALTGALLWNGIVSIFFGGVVSDWARGNGDGCATIFLVPFVLVGIGLIGAVGYYFLALFNPRPVVRIGDGSAALGETVELEWETSGNVERVTQFTITLEGREEATYRQGTNTKTDKSVFLSLVLVTSDKGRDLRRGKAKVAIPADTMHSFQSRNNRILWMFKLHGDIPKWPDVNEEYSFEILPQRLPPGGPA